ncbi:MAG: universal stress protein, partial [Bacteroidia bacterium]
MSKILIVGYTNNKNDTVKVKQYVAQVEKFLKHEAIECKPFFINDENFTESILNFASKQKADLVAIMTDHSFSLKQMLNGTHAQQFVNHSKIPVLSSPNTLQFDYSYMPSLSGTFLEY